MILFENVPAITTKKVEKNSNELIVDLLKDELKESGYTNYKEFVLNAVDYGVPQKRNRFFILATKDRNLKLSSPKATCDKPVTVKEAFCGLPNVVPFSLEWVAAHEETVRRHDSSEDTLQPPGNSCPRTAP